MVQDWDSAGQGGHWTLTEAETFAYLYILNEFYIFDQLEKLP